MFDRFKRSFDLVHASARILRQDNHLMLFPVISGFTMMLVVAAFLLPVLGFESIDGLGRSGLYSAAFLFYVVQYFVIFYFNTALVGAVSPAGWPSSRIVPAMTRFAQPSASPHVCPPLNSQYPSPGDFTRKRHMSVDLRFLL